jgi:hypothetical protein
MSGRGVWLGATLFLSGCAITDHARVYPMNDAAMRLGSPVMEFVRGQMHGPVTIAMPDGETLTGEFQVTDSTSLGVGFSGAHMATAIGMGVKSMVVTATGNRGTIINCQGAVDLTAHGTGTCDTNKGAQFRIMY